jgi:hypothetical protein
MSLEEIFRNAAAEATRFDLRPMMPRMIAATAVGAVLALRPWRLLLRRPLPRPEMIHAQILLCAAAAVITAVIGDSLAKAFGLVGLGGFVRFRSGLKDPRDAAILFLLIGLGMACGHGSLGLAAVGAAFVGLLLFALDLLGGESDAHSLTLHADTDDPAATEVAIRKAFGEANVVKRAALDFPNRKIELELEGVDPARVAQLLARGESAPLRGLRWSLSAEKKAQKEAREEQA